MLLIVFIGVCVKLLNAFDFDHEYLAYEKVLIKFSTDLPQDQEVIDKLRARNDKTDVIWKIFGRIDDQCFKTDAQPEASNDNEKESNMPPLEAYVSRKLELETELIRVVKKQISISDAVESVLAELKRGVDERKRRIAIVLGEKLGAALHFENLNLTVRFNKVELGQFLRNTGLAMAGTRFYSYAQLRFVADEIERISGCARTMHVLCAATDFAHVFEQCFETVRLRTYLNNVLKQRGHHNLQMLTEQLNADVRLRFAMDEVRGKPGSSNVTHGPQGSPGDAGDDFFRKGARGPKGVQGEPGEKGDKGDRGVDTYWPDRQMMSCFRNSSYPSLQYYKGNKGQAGDKGARGATGEKGEQGPTGDQGDNGDDLIQYLEFADGVQGQRGDDATCYADDNELFAERHVKWLSPDFNNIRHARWQDSQTQALLKARVRWDKRLAMLAAVLQTI